MTINRTKPWRRLACLRASRRRITDELAPPQRLSPEPDPVPPLEPPDDDREFLPHPQADASRFAPIPRPEPA